jgi:hypothetical protein
MFFVSVVGVSTDHRVSAIQVFDYQEIMGLVVGALR